MPLFSKADAEKLDKYLQNSNIHDSEFVEVKFDRTLCSVRVITVNPISKTRCIMEFLNVKLLFSGNEKNWGDDFSINTLAVIGNHSHADPQYISNLEFMDKVFHFVFELFSGSELHIFASEFLVEETYE